MSTRFKESPTMKMTCYRSPMVQGLMDGRNDSMGARGSQQTPYNYYKGPRFTDVKTCKVVRDRVIRTNVNTTRV